MPRATRSRACNRHASLLRGGGANPADLPIPLAFDWGGKALSSTQLQKLVCQKALLHTGLQFGVPEGLFPHREGFFDALV